MVLLLRNVFKGIGWVVGGLVGAVAVYLVAAVGLSAVPAGRQESEPREAAQVEAYVLSNGVHTDLVVPVRTAQIDWSRYISYADTPAADTTMRYVGFGWGDKGFYLHTPTWAQLKPGTALRAMFWLSTTAMHTTFHHRPVPGPKCVRLHLTSAQYARLIQFIQQTFAPDAQGQPQHISGYSYGRYDAFYEAKNTYNLFYTCNTWANAGLKAAGQKAALWTPFDFGIFWQYH